MLVLVFVFVFHSICMKMIAPCCCLLNWDLPVPPRWRSGCQAPWGRTASPRPRPRPSWWRPTPRRSPSWRTTFWVRPPLCRSSSFSSKRTGRCNNGPSTPWWPNWATHFKMFMFSLFNYHYYTQDNDIWSENESEINAQEESHTFAFQIFSLANMKGKSQNSKLQFVSSTSRSEAKVWYFLINICLSLILGFSRD